MSWPKPSNLGLIASKHALKPTHITHTHTHTHTHIKTQHTKDCNFEIFDEDDDK
jgi:hypothetical protein